MAEIPYKGLMPYDEADAPFFFGREAEREIISANLMASRLTLLYGASGVGKSSVLRAGVIRHLREVAEKNLLERGHPEFAIIIFNQWRDDPIKALAAEVEKGVSSFLPGRKTDEAEQMKGSLPDILRFWSEQIDGELLIILDQFEDYFLYHSQEDGERTFAVEFPRAVNRRDLRVSFLVSVREDALAKLDRFKGRIPSLFDNYLRIDHLDRSAARAAIEKPIAEYNRLQKKGEEAFIEFDLVEAILDQLRTGRVMLGAAGRGVVLGADESRIETPYLQLVMTRLWDEETQASCPPLLRLSTFERLGGAERIVRSHLDTTMSALPIDEQDAAARIFHYLVTPSGTKIAHAAADLAEYTQVSPSEIERILEKLSSTEVRILRPVAAPLGQPGLPRYEIFHDVLAGAIVDWRARYVRAQELKEAERRRIESERCLMEERAEAGRKLADARHRANKLRWGVIGLSLILLVMIGLAIFAFQQRSIARRAQSEAVSQSVAAEKAESEAVVQRNAAERARAEGEVQRQIAVARELSTAALNNLEVNPERSLLLSLYAVSAGTSQGRPVLRQAEEALHRAVQASRLQFALGSEHGAGEVSCVGVTFSPDGKRLATASKGRQGACKVWDAVTGKELFKLSGHAAQFCGVAFSPDGVRLATAGGDKTVSVWDIKTGKALLTLSGHSDNVNRVAFSPDGKRLATAGDDKTAKVWDAVTGKELFTLSGHTDRVSSVAFSSDGTRLATAGDDKTVRVWDAATGKDLLNLASHTSRPSGLAFSPGGSPMQTGASRPEQDGKDGLSSMILYVPFMRMATAGDDGNAILWDALSGQQLMTLYGSGESNSAIAFDTTGTRLVTGYSDGIAKVWDVATGRVLLTLYGEASPVLDITFSPDGRRVATAGNDGKARVWDVSPAGGAEWFTLVPPGGPVRDISYSLDGKRLATADGDGKVRIWDASNGKGLLTLQGRASGLALSPDGSRLAILGDNQTTRVWDTGTGKALFTLPADVQPSGPINHGVAFSSDGKRLATSRGTAIKFWDASTGKALLSLPDQADRILSVAFSRDNRRLATGSGTAMQIWDASTGKALPTLPGQAGTTYSVSFSPDGRWVAAGRMDKTVKVWNVITRETVFTLSGHKGSIYSVAFSPNGKLLATAGVDATVKVWDVSNVKELNKTPLTLCGHAGAIYRVVFSPDGRRLATASHDGTSRVYALPVEDLVAIAKSRVTRALTADECEKFLHTADCPAVP